MKLQHLAIIFVIIIFPIALVVGEYIQIQIDTIALQTSYNSKLQTATYDSMKAFRLNTVNNKYSTVSDSKVRDIEAAISSYFSSLGNEIKMDAYARQELEEYTPAILYTLYDGYYIYSKYYNDTDKEYQYGLKPYVYYTCRYKKGIIDIIVNYTLDNYITIYGNIGENYITKSGNIINPDMVTDITWQNGKLYSLKYGPAGEAITIEQEVLTEQIIYLDPNNQEHKATYSYIIYDNNKVYYDGINYFTINSNFKKRYINNQETILELKKYTKNGNLYSDSALNYYYEAYLFSKWTRQYLGEITQKHAVDEYGNQITDFAINTGNKPIFTYAGEVDITDTCFDSNRISVIRRSIQTNLMTSIANYNSLSQKGYEYVLPVFSEEEWYKLTTDISVVSFLQGIPIGAKYFNDYCIMTNNVNKEVVDLDSLYAITDDEEVHLINCKKILDNNIKVDKVYKNIDFERQSVVISEGNERYYYPHYETKCYSCLVNVAQTYDIDYLKAIVKEYDIKTCEYTEKTSVNLDALYYLRKEVLQAIGRESYDIYKINEYFKGYDETISTDSVTQEQTSNLVTSVEWNETTHKATVIAKKESWVEDTLKIQYLLNPTNQQISDNTAWQTVEGNEARIGDLFLEDKVYFRLYDGTYDGDYVTKVVKDTVAPTAPIIEIVEGIKGNNEYYTSDTVKVKITVGIDKESGVDRLEYCLEGDTIVSRQIIPSGEIIEIANNGITTIRAWTIDKAGNSDSSLLIIKKDALAPYEPTIEFIGNIGSNNYYNEDVTVKFTYGQERQQPNASGIKTLHYEIENVGVEFGTAFNGQQFAITMQGGIIVRAYMEDNAGNKSAVVVKTINRDATAPAVTAILASSDITTKSFRLNIGVKDEVSGIDKIVWYYKKSDESTYKTITTNCLGEKSQITKYVDLNNLISGVYNTYAIVYDKAGNTTQTGILNVTTMNVETAGGATASPTGWTNGNVTVILPTTEGYTTQYQVADSVNVNGTWTTYSSQLTITANTRVYYRYNDGTNAGSYGTLTISNIDKLAPGVTTVSYAGGSNSCTWKNNYNINLSASDADATTDNGKSDIAYYEIDWNADGVVDTTTGSNFIPWNGYSSCNTRFRAVDNAGNRGSWSGEHHIHMDNEAPEEVTVTYNGGANSCSWKNNYDITLSTTDNIAVSYYEIDTNGDGVEDRTTTGSFVPENGYNSCSTKFRAVDNAGNRSSWTGAHHIHMDTQSPTINTGLDSSVGTQEFTLSLSATDTISGMGRVVWYYKSSTESTYSTKTTSATGATSEESKSEKIKNATSGSYYAYAVVYDMAGNATTTSTITITVHTHVTACRHYHTGSDSAGTGCYSGGTRSEKKCGDATEVKGPCSWWWDDANNRCMRCHSTSKTTIHTDYYCSCGSSCGEDGHYITTYSLNCKYKDKADGSLICGYP